MQNNNNKISSLPYEIKNIITSYLDTHSFINFTKTDKQNSILDNDNYWKRKIHIDYPLIFKDDGKIKIYKKIYMKYHRTLCIECNKKTSLYNDFFNVKLCRPCERTIKKYEMLTKKKASDLFYLSSSEFQHFKFINRTNPYNIRRPLKLYLKSDIIKYNNEKRKKLIHNPTFIKRRNRSIKMVNKHAMIVNILQCIYNVSRIDLNLNIFPFINGYSNNLYKRYIKYDTVSNKKNNISELINKCLEINFIKKYTALSSSIFNNFDELLFYFLISNRFNILSLNINSYIDAKISACYNNNKEIFKRKIEMAILLDNSNVINNHNYFKNHIVFKYICFGKENMTRYFTNEENSQNTILYNIYNIQSFGDNNSLFIYEYINRKGSNFIQNIKDVVELEYFLYSNTCINNILFFKCINRISINFFETYLKVFYTWYIKNPRLRYKIPVNLYKFILH